MRQNGYQSISTCFRPASALLVNLSSTKTVQPTKKMESVTLTILDGKATRYKNDRKTPHPSKETRGLHLVVKQPNKPDTNVSVKKKTNKPKFDVSLSFYIIKDSSYEVGFQLWRRFKDTKLLGSAVADIGKLQTGLYEITLTGDLLFAQDSFIRINVDRVPVAAPFDDANNSTQSITGDNCGTEIDIETEMPEGKNVSVSLISGVITRLDKKSAKDVPVVDKSKKTRGIVNN